MCLELENSDIFRKSVRALDQINIKDTFKFGICYINEGQTTEDEIFGNYCGSPCYDGVGFYEKLFN